MPAAGKVVDEEAIHKLENEAERLSLKSVIIIACIVAFACIAIVSIKCLTRSTDRDSQGLSA